MSGRETQAVQLRLPASLHALVKRVADDEGVTVNAFLVAVIARGTAEFDLKPIARFDSSQNQKEAASIILINPRTKAAHDPNCTWIHGAATGTQTIDLANYLEVPHVGPFPEGTHGVSCCFPTLPPDIPRSSRKRRSA